MLYSVNNGIDFLLRIFCGITLSVVSLISIFSVSVRAETALENITNKQNLLDYILQESSNESYYSSDSIYVNVGASKVGNNTLDIEYAYRLINFYGYFFNLKGEPDSRQIRIAIGPNVINDAKAGKIDVLFPKILAMLREDASCYLESTTDQHVRHNISAQIMVNTGNIEATKECMRDSMASLFGFNITYKKFIKKNFSYIDDLADEYYDAIQMVAIGVRNKCNSYMESKPEYELCVRGALGK